MRDVLASRAPDVYIVTSSDLLPEPPEFERSSTTAANAYLGPIFRNYANHLSNELSGAGFQHDIFVMHSGGGLLPVSMIKEVPVRTVMSGPAAGVLAAAELSRRAGRANVISVDIGGTSADISTVVEGETLFAKEYHPEFGMPIRFPTIDLVTVGAGGGSIAWIDEGGAPKVGPQSAGARPGPAAYGTGGTDATVTDANLVLGRLSAERGLAGGLTLDIDLAKRAVQSFADSLRLSLTDAAEGILRIANANMARYVRVMTVERGLDPREFSLFAFGGAGPMLCVDLARELGVPEVIVPPAPGVTAALGLLYANMVHDYSSTYIALDREIDCAVVKEIFAEMKLAAAKQFGESGFSSDELVFELLADVRYLGQVKALTLPADRLVESSFADLRTSFEEAYFRRYKCLAEDLPLEVSLLRLRASSLLPEPPTMRVAVRDDLVESTRGVIFGGVEYETPVVNRASLKPGTSRLGPMIVNQLDTTTIVPPATEVNVDGNGNLMIRVEA